MMAHRMRWPFASACLLLLSGVVAPRLEAQQPPPSPVRYTEAREYSLRQTMTLPGTVEAPDLSPVASEVEGFVTSIIAREGTSVSRGAPLVKISRRNLELDLKGVEGEILQAEARSARAERLLNRAKELLADELISPTEFDEVDADFKAWSGQLQQLEARRERIALDLDRCTIRSPITGTVTREHVEVGSWLNMGDAVMDIISTGTLEVRVELPEKYYHQARIDVPATVTVGEARTELPATVSAVIPRASSSARVFPVKLKVPNQDGRLAAGMLVEVSLPLGEPAPSLIVPKDAIVSQGPMKFVYVLQDDNSATQTPVEVGSGVGAWVSVRGELAPGAKVITRGNERIFPGMPLAGEPLEYELP